MPELFLSWRLCRPHPTLRICFIFIRLAFHLFDAAFDLSFVHDALLVMTVNDGPEQRTRYFNAHDNLTMSHFPNG